MGSLTMKSMAMDVNGVKYISDEIGNRGGLGLFAWFLFAWHSVHPLMYLVMSFFMDGHQKSRVIAHVVLEIPGCPPIGES